MRRASDMVRSHGLESSVRFLGPAFGEAFRDLLDNTDLLVMPTYHEERLPYAVLEAMAVGIPPVTCRKAALSRVITHSVDGIFVRP